MGFKPILLMVDLDPHGIPNQPGALISLLNWLHPSHRVDQLPLFPYDRGIGHRHQPNFNGFIYPLVRIPVIDLQGPSHPPSTTGVTEKPRALQVSPTAAPHLGRPRDFLRHPGVQFDVPVKDQRLDPPNGFG